ncbi:MAG TPA: phosphoribosyltransferase family protein [Bacteroidota bacterium]|nr:phosphoribosyltransferase family protein [Bacteroidota bacterium]
MPVRPPTLLRPLGAVSRMIADFVFPPVCLSCNLPLESGASITCPACRRAMVDVDDWDERYRSACGSLCSAGDIAGFVAAWYFEEGGAVQALVHALKYGGIQGAGTAMGRALGERVGEAGYATADAVIALPLHPARSRERGFNQAECIAGGVSLATGIPLGRHIVRRRRFTPSQTALTGAERDRNMRGAFAPARRARDAAGMSVLLVDDVVTTGATMRQCAAALRAAGARTVIACAVALAR